MQDTLYREEILEHYKNPSNFGKPEVYDASSKQTNPFCGDEIEMFVAWEKGDKGVVNTVGFEGIGCAISMASTSLLTEQIKGKTQEELTKFGELDMLALLGIEISETRKKCALLGLAVLKDCLYAKI